LSLLLATPTAAQKSPRANPAGVLVEKPKEKPAEREPGGLRAEKPRRSEGWCGLAAGLVVGTVRYWAGPSIMGQHDNAESTIEFHDNADMINKKAAERLGMAAPMRGRGSQAASRRSVAASGLRPSLASRPRGTGPGPSRRKRRVKGR
jgi:hypothetical protein